MELRKTYRWQIQEHNAAFRNVADLGKRGKDKHQSLSTLLLYRACLKETIRRKAYEC